MYVCVYVCMYACMYVCMYVCTLARMCEIASTNFHMRWYIHIYIYIYINVCYSSLSLRTCVHRRIRLYISDIYTHMCMFVCHHFRVIQSFHQWCTCDPPFSKPIAIGDSNMLNSLYHLRQPFMPFRRRHAMQARPAVQQHQPTCHCRHRSRISRQALQLSSMTSHTSRRCRSGRSPLFWASSWTPTQDWSPFPSKKRASTWSNSAKRQNGLLSLKPRILSRSIASCVSPGAPRKVFRVPFRLAATVSIDEDCCIWWIWCRLRLRLHVRRQVQAGNMSYFPSGQLG